MKKLLLLGFLAKLCFAHSIVTATYATEGTGGIILTSDNICILNSQGEMQQSYPYNINADNFLNNSQQYTFIGTGENYPTPKIGAQMMFCNQGPAQIGTFYVVNVVND